MNKSNYLWGFVFVVLGVIWGLNALEVTNIDIFFDGWWTLFIIVPCFIDLFKDKDKTGDIIGLFIGVGLFLACQDLIDFGLVFKLIIPFALIIIGLSFIFKDMIKSKMEKCPRVDNGALPDYSAIFGSQNVVLEEEFNGCNLNAVFGGVKCDFKNAIIEKDVVVNASSIFGGITIYTPSDVNVKIISTPIFGGVTNDRKIKKKDATVTIYIKALCLFGGVSVK